MTFPTLKNPALPRSRPLFSLLTLVLASTVYATENEARLPEVVVSSSPLGEIPEASGTLSHHHLHGTRAATADTAQLLRDIPGVAFSGAGGVSTLPVIHGLSDDRNRIKVDGMDLISACGNHMNPPLSYIAPTNVESIKVYTGLVPVSVGGDSIGGAIVVSSPEPRFASSPDSLLKTGEAGSYYRSNGRAFGANVSATLATDRLSVSYAGSVAQSDNYQAGGDFKAGTTASWTTAGSHYLSGKEVGSTAYKSENHQVGIALRGDDQQIDLKLGIQRIPYQGFPNQHMDMVGNDSSNANLRYKGRFGWGGLEARVYYEETRHKMDFSNDKLYWYGSARNVAGMPMETHGRNLGASIKAEHELNSRDILRFGSDIQFYRLDDWWAPVANSSMMGPNTFQNINNGQRNRFDLFSEVESAWSPRWTTLFGTRLSSIQSNADSVQGYNAMYATAANAFNAASRQKNDLNIDLTGMARYTASPTFSLEGGLARKTRSPSLYERYTWSTNAMAMTMNNWVNDGNGYVGDVNLKPEVAHTVSLTADFHDESRTLWQSKITPYYSVVDNYIDAKCLTTCTPNQFNYLKLVNQDARLYGLDLSGFAQLANSASTGEIRAKGSIAYTSGKNTQTGDYLYNIMPLNARLAVEQRFGNWTHSIEGLLVSAKTDVSQVRNEMRTPGYGVMNLRASYDTPTYRIDMGIENAFNRLYYYPLGGAYIGQGTTMSLNGSGAPYGIPVPGMGRSFNVGVSLKI